MTGNDEPEHASTTFAGGMSVARGEISCHRTNSSRVQIEAYNQVELVNSSSYAGDPPVKSEDKGEVNRSSDPDDEDDTSQRNIEEKVESTIGSISKMRLTCGKIVNDERSQTFIVILIIINSIMMGIGTFDFITGNEALDGAFQKTDKAFLIVFTIELVMQIIYRGWTLLLDGWLDFDLVIILLSWSFEQVQIIRAFRIFRALRLITRVETLRNLVLALFKVLPNLAAICCLLTLIFYIFAVMFTTLFKDNEAPYFKRLDASLFTLFQLMTLDYVDVVRPIVHEYYWSWSLFAIYLGIAGFIVFNLIIAVVVDAVADIEKESKQQREEEEEDNETYDVPTQLKDLRGEVLMLMQKQKESQAAMDSLAKELYRLHKISLPKKLRASRKELLGGGLNS
uniref:Ion transport domain-containing protein n=1 Tax=Trieres chinensis TaxID=1514140 RepID=A0A6U1XI95_TRICV|mmetsp:Transcript_33870/g.69150  ORF Transcript_33870/g.69150 Transcript_33870/m.69150 type:complete len:396 (+) Transcript_33870:176-1363(+)